MKRNPMCGEGESREAKKKGGSQRVSSIVTDISRRNWNIVVSGGGGVSSEGLEKGDRRGGEADLCLSPKTHARTGKNRFARRLGVHLFRTFTNLAVKKKMAGKEKTSVRTIRGEDCAHFVKWRKEIRGHGGEL